ncbi:uncharacterized protein [Diabrotica undecimpunctata]|uniref:uncharacterized protein n=1 Tax=Diabrotica undecimpunctata TaxID=50387 RepID=UPI003B63F14A
MRECLGVINKNKMSKKDFSIAIKDLWIKYLTPDIIVPGFVGTGSLPVDQSADVCRSRCVSERSHYKLSPSITKLEIHCKKIEEICPRSQRIINLLNVSHLPDEWENSCDKDPNVSNEEKENIPLSSSENFLKQQEIAENTLPLQNSSLVETNTVTATTSKRSSRSSSSSSSSSSSVNSSSSSSSSSSYSSRCCSLEQGRFVSHILKGKEIEAQPQSLSSRTTSPSILESRIQKRVMLILVTMIPLIMNIKVENVRQAHLQVPLMMVLLK